MVDNKLNKRQYKYKTTVIMQETANFHELVIM